MLRDYTISHQGNHGSGDNVDLDETSPFVKVTNNSGKKVIVRKSSVCWLLCEDKFKLSSDRLQRVQEKDYSNKRDFRREGMGSYLLNAWLYYSLLIR